MKKIMPLKKSQTIRKQQPRPQYTDRLLSQEIIPIIDKSMYDQVYPSRSTSRSQLECGLTESELSLLPKPSYTIVPNYFIEKMASFPIPYIHFMKSSQIDLTYKIEYDMDEEDVAWLGLINDERRKGSIDTVEVRTFELLMDMFEKECKFDKKIFYEGEMVDEITDDEAVCNVCTGGKSLVMNEILFCDMCNIGIHQECYGVPYIPEGPWICRRCCYSPSQLLCCVLCPNASGAFKQTDRGFWCHIVCAIWIPEVQFSNSTFIDPICGIEKIPSSRWNLTCSICKIRDVGACLRCRHRSCRTAFHVSCAQYAGYDMMMKLGCPGYKKQRVHGIYCPKHTQKKGSNNQYENTNNINLLKSNIVNSLCSNIVLIPYIPPEKIKDIADQVEFEKKNIFIRRLLAYWSLKRHVRSGVPMIPSRSFGLEQESDNNSANPIPYEEKTIPQSVSEQQEENTEKVETESFQQLNLIRHDLEKVRILCELVRKREKLKSELALIKYKCLEYQFAPLMIYLRKFIESLIELDTDNLFSKAVDGSEAVTSRPTDFVQIRLKIDSLQYSSLEEFENDFHEMISSRIICYGKRTKIYKSATKLREQSKEKFMKAYEDVADMGKQINQHKKLQGSEDIPEPLSPQIKDESYENPMATEFPTEIDYYGDDISISGSFQQTNNKNVKSEREHNHTFQVEAGSSFVDSGKEIDKKPIRIKITNKRRSQIVCSEGGNPINFTPHSTSPEPPSGINRRTSVSSTRYRSSKPKQNQTTRKLITRSTFIADED